MKDELVVFRSEQELDGNRLVGVAHAYGTHANINGLYVETFTRGAFDEAVSEGKTRALYQHDVKMLLGSQGAKTLELRSTDSGLEYVIDLPNTSYANDLKELVLRGDISAMSIGFRPSKFQLGRTDKGEKLVNHINIGYLRDISPVTIPAYGDGTSVQLRNNDYTNDVESVRSQLIRMRVRNLR